MAGTGIVYAVVLILLTIVLYRRWQMRRGSTTLLPRGTLGLPIVGETLEFISCAYSPRPESFMDKRRLLYGKVFKSHILGSPTIISTDAEVNRAVLQGDERVFVPSYPKSLTELMGSSSILCINGSLQKRLHGLIGAFLKSPLLKAQITQDIQKYVQGTMDNWNDGQLVSIQNETKHVLVKALISLDPGEEIEFLKHQFREFNAGLISLPVKLPGTQLYRSLQAKKRMVKLVQKIIQERRKCSPIKQAIPRDVLDALLTDTSDQLTFDLISDNMIDLMIPGEDSVPILMTLAIKYLTDHPLALQQLLEENKLLKKGKSDEQGQQLLWSDYMSLPFTQNVITETLRMGNIITGVMRKAMKDVVIKGYLIPKGWCVFTYFRSVHLDEKHYQDPYQFNPWRWQDKEPSVSSFTPFGGGQRLCPGLDLARLEASIFLHHFVTGFRWVAEEDSIVNFPTVRMKRGMPIRVIKRTGVLL